MKNKYVFVLVMLLVLTFFGMGLTETYLYVNNEEEEVTQELTVVTSFYPMYVAAANVIDDISHVTLQNLSEPQTGCLHDYQLTPADMKLLSTADVFIVNGGGIESFLSDVAAQYPELRIINATEDVDLIPDNAHAWMNVEDYMTEVSTIAVGLAAADEPHEDQYYKNAEAYQDKLMPLLGEIEEIRPYTQGKNIVIFHEAYDYVAEEYGMKVSYVMDLDEERQVSAGEVADVIREITENHTAAVLAEELYGKDMGDTVIKETGAPVYYLDTLVRGDYQKDSYLNAMKANIQIMREAFVQ